MKKHRAFLMAGILVLTCLLRAGAACAENNMPNIWEVFGIDVATETPTETPQPTITPSPDAFRFRDGIRWGMNPQQVKALERENMVERVLQDWAIMVAMEKVAVSRFTADLVFIFRQEQLKMIIYEFCREDTESDFQYLTGALCSLYGEKKETDPSVVRVLMDAINPGRYKAEEMTKSYGWLLSDGTAIFQYQYAADSFGVMYVSPELGGNLYQTNGL